jgi:oxygen-dependent protoporphyrinogen oxidase
VTTRPHVTVIGGGIAGLVAARALVGEADVTIVEAGPSLGGKVRSSTFRGRPLDLGPDAFITRNGAAADLCRALGLGDELITPSVASAAIWARGRLRPFPKGLAIGIPTDLVALAASGILSPTGSLRAAVDVLLPGRAPASLITDARSGRSDPSVGALVGGRLGREVLDALVDPLIGGINASDIDSLSFVAALPQLAPLIAGSRRLTTALRAATTSSSASPLPLFYGLERGLGSLIDALEGSLGRAGAQVRLDTPARALERVTDGRWIVHTGTGPIDTDGVACATPAGVAADLLEGIDRELARELRSIPYAGVVTVTLAWPHAAVPPRTAASLGAITRATPSSNDGSAKVLPGSGVLVPRSHGRLITAATFTSTKWPRSANPGEVVLRASAGRHGDERALTLDDGALLDAVKEDLAAILGIRDLPLEHLVARWPASFPQYVSGHLARVERIRSRTSAIGGLALCGAAYGGIGLPACVESGTAAAAALTAGVRNLG